MNKKIIKFSATWCAPCKSYAPVFEELIELMNENNWAIIFADVDTDEGKELAQKYSIRSVPTTVFVYDADKYEAVTGVIDHNKLSDLIKK